MLSPTTVMGATTGLSGVAQRLAPLADDVALAGMKARKTRQRKATTSVPQPVDTDRVGAALQRAEGVANKLGMADMVLMPVSAIGAGIAKLGAWRKWGAVSKTGEMIQAPGEYMGKTLLKDSMFSGAFQGTANAVAGATAGTVGTLSRVTGAGKWLHGRHTRLVDVSFGKAKGLLDKVELSTLPKELQSHMRDLHGMVRNAGSAAQLPTARIEKTLLAIKSNRGNLAGFSSAAHHKLTRQVENTLAHSNGITRWKNISLHIKSIPEGLGKVSVGHALSHGAWVAGSGISMVSDGRGFFRDLTALKQMNHDITGKNLSTLGLLFGSVPPMIAKERSRLIKTIAIKEGTDAAGMAANIKGMLTPQWGMLRSMAAYMIPGFLGSAAESYIGSTLPEYEALRSSFDPKKPMPVEYYASFIGAMNKDLKARGGASSPFTQEVAKQYAAAHATPQQILREINNGKLDARIEAVTIKKKAQATPHSTAKPKERPVVGKHTKNVVKNEAVSHSQHPAGNAVT